MNRGQIEDAKALAKEFIVSCDTALAQLDAELESRNEWLVDRGEDPYKSSRSDHSYGSKATGALRRRSLDLTRALAELRKPG